MISDLTGNGNVGLDWTEEGLQISQTASSSSNTPSLEKV